ncbi:MAG: ABC transporter permease [Clostridiales Family XIII bacterium]|jgi:simple sugar transport system permease protein|nr:ABC transporter permease [Clostridiales Family XIII bacterium]
MLKKLNLNSGMIPVISVVFGLILGAIIMLVFGYNPLNGYRSLFTSALGTPRSIGETLRQATPLIFTALGFSVANSAGFFNIGLSGQALCGWVASTWFALSNPDMPRFIMLPLAVLIGALAGAMAAAIPGVLRAFFGTSEVIVTIMLNYVFLYVGNHLLHNVFSREIMTSMDSTKKIGANATLRADWLTDLAGGSRLNLGIFFALIGLVIVWFLMKKTTLGFEIRGVGINPYASEYAGISSKRTIILSMIISGALAGLGGVIEGLGTFENFFAQGASLSIGYDGMAVSLLGSGSAIGILLAALLFSVLKIGSAGMNIAGIPPEIVNVVIASIIFFVGVKYLIQLILSKRPARKVKDNPKDKVVISEGGEL